MDIQIVKESKKEISAMLNKLLADEFVLYTKVRNFHWNVKGPHFHEYHKFFEELYTEIETHIDDTAERVRTLGERPLGSLKEFLELSELKENNSEISAKEMIKELAQDYQTMIVSLRNVIEETGTHNDIGTEDFATNMLQDYEKKLWMVNSMVE